MKRTAMRPVSKRKARDQAGRVRLVGALAGEGVGCQIGHVLAARGVHICTGRIGGIHERRKRSASGSTVVGLNLIPACNACNGWIEDRLPILARDNADLWRPVLKFLVVREGDPEWEACGIRASGAPLVALACRVCAVPYTTPGPTLDCSLVPPCGHSQIRGF